MPASEIANSIISQLGAVDSYPNSDYIKRQLSFYREEVISECQTSLKDLGIEVTTCPNEKLTNLTVCRLIWTCITHPYALVRSLFLCTTKLCYHTLEDLKASKDSPSA